jgi:hypothetical protein
VIPLIKNLIQLAVVPEVNGAGIMFSACGLWATVASRRALISMYLKQLDIFVNFADLMMAATLCPLR